MVEERYKPLLYGILVTAPMLAASAAVFILWPPSITEILWGAFFVAWNCFIIFYASKLVAAKWNKYVARKFIHFMTGGLVAILAPYIFRVPTVPFAGAMLMTMITVLPRFWRRELEWFQVRGNLGDTWFCLSWGIVFLAFWYVDIWIAVVAALFMAFGDGVTGIVRNRVYGRWVKGWWGSLAMILVSLPIGFFLKGIDGALTAVVAMLVERMPYIDDNISVPLVTAICLYIASIFGI